VTALTGVGAAARLSAPALWLTGLERGLMLAGLVVALGGLAGRGLARQYRGERPGPLPGPWAVRGSLLGLAACAALVVTARAGPGLAAQLASPPAAGLRSGGTAVIAAVEVVLFALAAVLARQRRPGWSAVMLSAVILAEGIRSHPEGIVPVGGAMLAYCHVTPAVLWAGLLTYALRTGIAWRHHPAAVQGIIRLYATAAAWLFGMVLVSGIISALVLVPLGSLLTTAYGVFLVAKVVVVAAAAGFAVAGRRWLGRQPVPGAGPSQVTRLELAVLAVVLAITGILTVLTPPARPISASPAASEAALVHAAPPARLGSG
jgi:copper transport protein